MSLTTTGLVTVPNAGTADYSGVHTYNVSVQASFFSSSGTICSSTGIAMLGPNSRRISVRYPLSGGWYSPLNVTTPSKLAAIDVICMGNTPKTAGSYIAGIFHLRVAVRNEVVPVACPKMLSVPLQLRSTEDSDDELVVQMS